MVKILNKNCIGDDLDIYVRYFLEMENKAKYLSKK